MTTSEPLSPCRPARRAAKRTISRVAVLTLLAGTSLLLVTFFAARHLTTNDAARPAPATRATSSRPQVLLPSTVQIRRARIFAKQRSGVVSFAVIDTSGSLRCYRCDRRSVSASVVKPMSLVAYLEQIAEDECRLRRRTECCSTR